MCFAESRCVNARVVAWSENYIKGAWFELLGKTQGGGNLSHPRSVLFTKVWQQAYAPPERSSQSVPPHVPQDFAQQI